MTSANEQSGVRDFEVAIPDGFRLETGGRLEQTHIRARLQGRTGAPVVVVAGGVSSGRDAADWWPQVVHIGGPIDLERLQVLGFDFVPEGASTPPTLTTGDQARLLALALDAAGVECVSYVGASYGGMVGLAFAERFPERLERLLVISAAHRAHPMATAWRGIQRRILAFAREVGRPADGIALARELAMTTYRTPAEFAQRFGGDAPAEAGGAYPVCDYLIARGQAYPERMSEARWVALSDSMDRHRVRPEAVVAPTTLLAFDSDRLVPLADMQELAARLPALTDLVVRPSLYGHDAFLKEDDAVASVLRRFFAEGAQPSLAAIPASQEPAVSQPIHPCTAAARSGVDRDPAFGSVMPPLHLSSNYSFAGFDQKRRYDYTRSGNPTRDLLGETLAELEGGAGAVVVATGMAAVDLALSDLEPGDLLLAPHDCYGGTHRLLCARQRKGHFRVEFVDQTDPAAFEAALAQRPKLVLVESPSNPLMRLVDIAEVCRRAKAAGAKVAVDNTFLSPALQQPIRLGADLVIHSTTKYINGHSDVVGGAVVAADPEDVQRLTWWANCLGVTGSPFDAYLTLRGVRTLFARVERQQVTAQKLAEALAVHPAVRAVHYPGLPGHPGHEIAKRQQSGFGAMLSFELNGGVAEVRQLVESVNVFTLAESLGGVESLIAHPATMTHAAMDPDARRRAGIGDSLLRLSVGLEHEDDLVRDLIGALDALVTEANALSSAA
ncbi:cystathionine gamma-synthase [Caulobacter sp. 17J65-9]|uniref:cystathionine gamma-synthase n=1 Tax=Caulobacter sp. 17J65-9 TaxID=2709382 RepID=UPI0013CCEDE8|nr:cystathionine gamma-synthase [Caulobacter sp. 17J65-9]NEX92230.1 cystathionine gamma-synthase [Caulobacter sp. 17J65-9]